MAIAYCSPTWFTSPAISFALSSESVGNWLTRHQLSCIYFQNLTPKAHSLNCSMTFVPCGMRLPKKRGAAGVTQHLYKSFDTPAIFTLPYIKVPMRPRLHFPRPLKVKTTPFTKHPRILCATSRV